MASERESLDKEPIRSLNQIVKEIDEQKREFSTEKNVIPNVHEKKIVLFAPKNYITKTDEKVPSIEKFVYDFHNDVNRKMGKFQNLFGPMGGGPPMSNGPQRISGIYREDWIPKEDSFEVGPSKTNK